MTKLLKKNYYPILLILILVFSRLIPHPPNFTPIITVALLSGYIFKNLKLSLFVLIVSMLLSDIFIAFYTNMIFVYISLILICLISNKVIANLNYKNLFLFSLMGSILFFVITNFGTWILGGLYEKNISGLINCYFLAIPFFKNTIISTLLFSYLSFLIIKLPLYKKSSLEI